ncbi:MAG: hypothetical protein PVS2B2_23680 [Candidatus Acidiferrum sp.]
MATSAVKFQQMLAWLMTEVMFGRAHFMITSGLSRADQAVLDTAPKFFDLTRDAHANAAQLAAARIFDQSSGVSIYKLMSSAVNEAGTFKHGTAVEVRKLVSEAKGSVRVLEPVVSALRIRRNETIAHSDTRPIIDPKGYAQAGRIGYRELGKLFEQTGLILNKFSLLYRGASVVLDLKGVKDYEHALGLIAKANRETVSSR